MFRIELSLWASDLIFLSHSFLNCKTEISETASWAWKSYVQCCRNFLYALWFSLKVIFSRNNAYIWTVKDTEFLEESGVNPHGDQCGDRTHSKGPLLHKLLDPLNAHLWGAQFFSLLILSVLISLASDLLHLLLISHGLPGHDFS